MKIADRFILTTILIIAFFANANAQFDYSRPFPLSLLDYSRAGGYWNPRPLDVVNIQINTDSTTQLQNEEMVCINPRNTNNAVAIWRDFRLGFRRVGIGYSFDAGQTWHDTLLFVPPYAWQSDPVLCVDTSGNFFACTLCLNSTGQGPTGIYVQKSTDGGVSWSDPVIAIDSAAEYFEDKQMMTIDNSAGPHYGNIYIAWTRFTADFRASNIYMLASTNGGQSYNAPVQVSEGSGVQWPVPAVRANGDVFVAWFSYFPQGIYLDYTDDQGYTFGSDIRIVNVSATAGEINGGILVFPYPALAIDTNPSSPYLNSMYIAYMDNAGSDMDILFVRSDDGWDWSTPIRINDDQQGNGCDQFHPWISIDDRGVIHAVFYDRRLDPVNRLFDLYYTQSSDGGLTWSPNERITTVSSDPSQAALAGLIGEYVGLSAWRGEVQMAWTDTRNGNQDVFSGRMSLTAVDDKGPLLPGEMGITSVYPNPFNGSVAIRYFNPGGVEARLDIVDLLGRRVRRLGTISEGSGAITWDGIDDLGDPVASGPYFVRLAGDGAIQAKKVVLLR
jgi:hypothetical protein